MDLTTTSPTRTRTSHLDVSSAVSLVSVDTARAVLGMDTESVADQVDRGRLRWVWDFASPGSETRRELRFWALELVRYHCDPGTMSPHPEDLLRVIAEVIGPTPGGRQRAAVLAIRFSISAQLIMDMVRAGVWAEDRVQHTRFIRRHSLENFLQARLIQ
ncbi:MAG: hypothetical protein KF791_08465 [Verrucomicrobiae bacterium]|nr:hypothetical protein [Verrucomicrobiae bacterium]